MYYRIIDKDIKVALSIPKFANELYILTDKNRKFLKKWLPWLDSTKNTLDTKNFINEQLEKFAKEKALHQCIFYKEKLVGVLGFNKIENGIGSIGYWLDEEYNKLGIMTKCVDDLIKIGFEDLKLQKIEIHCATKNIKSQAIAKKLKLKKEKIIKNAENLYGTYVDHIVFSITK